MNEVTDEEFWNKVYQFYWDRIRRARFPVKDGSKFELNCRRNAYNDAHHYFTRTQRQANQQWTNYIQESGKERDAS